MANELPVLLRLSTQCTLWKCGPEIDDSRRHPVMLLPALAEGEKKKIGVPQEFLWYYMTVL